MLKAQKTSPNLIFRSSEAVSTFTLNELRYHALTELPAQQLSENTIICSLSISALR